MGVRFFTVTIESATGVFDSGGRKVFGRAPVAIVTGAGG